MNATDDKSKSARALLLHEMPLSLMAYNFIPEKNGLLGNSYLDAGKGKLRPNIYLFSFTVERIPSELIF